jgi:hypothetical protein
LVADILAGHTLGDGLRAFIPGSSVEIGAILAGTQIRAALGTLTFQPNLHGNDRAAHGAAKHFTKARHGPRAKFLGPLGLGWSRLFFLMVLVLITALAVLSLHNAPVNNELNVSFIERASWRWLNVFAPYRRPQRRSGAQAPNVTPQCGCCPCGQQPN